MALVQCGPWRHSTLSAMCLSQAGFLNWMGSRSIPLTMVSTLSWGPFGFLCLILKELGSRVLRCLELSGGGWVFSSSGFGRMAPCSALPY